MIPAKVIDKIIEVFRPSAIVLQCGADSLAGDKLGCFNLTMQGHAHCVQYIRDKNIPLILLGGGGYTVKNVARAWTYETACALGMEDQLDPNMPWNEYFEWFGPRYRLEVVENNMDDVNLKDGSLDSVRTSVLKQLSELQPAPSVGLQDVPKQSVGEHLGVSRDDEQDVDELDEKLAQHARFVYDLQEGLASDASDDEPFSDESSSSRRVGRSRTRRHVRSGKKRMSIVTSQYFDVPRLEEGSHGFFDMCGGDQRSVLPKGPSYKRRFFQSAARWDPQMERVLLETDGLAMPRPSVSDVMERGGRELLWMRDDWSIRVEDETSSMDVDTEGGDADDEDAL